MIIFNKKTGERIAITKADTLRDNEKIVFEYSKLMDFLNTLDELADIGATDRAEQLANMHAYNKLADFIKLILK